MSSASHQQSKIKSRFPDFQAMSFLYIMLTLTAWLAKTFSPILWVKWALVSSPRNLFITVSMRKLILSFASEFRIHLSTSYSSSYHSGEHSIWPSGMNEEGHFIFLITHLEMNRRLFIKPKQIFIQEDSSKLRTDF